MNIPPFHSQYQSIRSDDCPVREPLFPEQRLISRRQLWANNRFHMEMENLKTRRYGNRGRHHWYQLLFMMKSLKFLLRLTGLYRKGMRNAENIVLTEMPIYFSNLPQAFDGFTILHLSDLHLDGMKGIEDRILGLLGGTVDLYAAIPMADRSAFPAGGLLLHTGNTAGVVGATLRCRA